MAHMPVSHTGHSREPARPRTTVYEPSMVPKSKEARVGKLCKLNMTPIRVKTSYGLAQHVVALPTGSLVLTRMGPVNCSGASCDRGI